MFTFITIVSTNAEKASGEKVFVHNPFPNKETLVAKIETRALTAAQAEKQAIAKSDLTVRDGFGAIIDDAKLTFNTIRKFAVEVDRS